MNTNIICIEKRMLMIEFEIHYFQGHSAKIIFYL